MGRKVGYFMRSLYSIWIPVSGSVTALSIPWCTRSLVRMWWRARALYNGCRIGFLVAFWVAVRVPY
eukprot:scaffold35592_cov46-Attheya_sp.AAC.1